MVVALVAGFVDAIAGGGGLLTLPALLLSGLPPHTTLATNKGQSVFGSGMALFRFSRSELLDRKRAPFTFAGSATGAAIGALLLSVIPTNVLRPVMIVLLFAVAIFMLLYRPTKDARPARRQSILITLLVGSGIGFYDGIFGPGTGTIFIMAFLLLWHDALDSASANAKVGNFASNLASLVMFALGGHVLWKVALPMAVGQAIGGWLGAHTTVKHGQGLVRVMVVCASLAVVARLAWGLRNGG